MARTPKNGLDYFPLDVISDDKLNLIEAEFGITGWAIIIKLYQRIYSISYYTNWGPDEILLFSKAINVDINTINVVINKAIDRNIFNGKTLNERAILTSKGIQQRYIEATLRRKEVSMFKGDLCPGINDYIKSKDVNINLLNDGISTQSKVNKSKVEESKGEEKSTPPIEIVEAVDPITRSYSQKFLEYILEHHPNKTKSIMANRTKSKVLEAWDKEVKKILKLYTGEQFELASDYAVTDDFWKGNVYSISKFMKKNKEGVRYIDVFLDNASRVNSSKTKRALYEFVAGV